ncbi:PASTA domain-containing protein [Thermotalea metallivorans]|uniref:PASTA domain-containing protein n=1 Tax=Thermotalea metallivorans TaxID=520762 RepID=A0A140L5F9_9FIRM|nr:PASTA domain-containing protein [Thermotalea metallivorans]KXG75784.1 hypothetical protein AN619_15380 [Thermotalea metallivorans]
MYIPDVVGFPLEKAQDELTKLGLGVVILETFSPKEKEPIGECRVVKQTQISDQIELTVSFF